MVILNYTTTKFFEYLKGQGVNIIDNYTDDNVVVFEFQEKIVPVQIRTEYYPPLVVKVCEALRIPCPIDFKKVAKQMEQARHMNGKNKK